MNPAARHRAVASSQSPESASGSVGIEYRLNCTVGLTRVIRHHRRFRTPGDDTTAALVTTAVSNVSE